LAAAARAESGEDMKDYTHIIYHGGCPDGFGAAWAAWKMLADQAVYIPSVYEQPLPELPRHAKVLFLDFCPPKPALFELAAKVKDVMVIDHHQSSADGMKGVPWAHFDMEHSGAYLSWMHFFGEPVPDFVKYLEDRDLWRFDMPYSREVAVALGSYPMKFDVWEAISSMGMEKLKLDGGPLLRYQARKIEEMIARVSWRDFDGHKVPVVNASVMYSEVGDKLCQIYPEVPFAAYFFMRADGKTQWGLRSPGRFNVLEIAKARGGGGHPNAAGFVEDKK
jgi:oligoribonuclease NrnB/cAMP/cGMP phosphodiesterase (DHH superfamily)